MLEEVAGIYRDKLKVVLLEEAFIEVFKSNLRIAGTPTFIMMKRGEEIARVLGITDREALIEIILATVRNSFKEDW